jgi:CheY-like chemotaxis protein
MAMSDVNKDLVVLVVDDNRVIRELVTRQLAKLGVRSETAVDGNDAIAKLEQSPYDIVLMDVQMPELDGIAATQ